jgi:pilus assembly protein Flp/PilA
VIRASLSTVPLISHTVLGGLHKNVMKMVQKLTFTYLNAILRLKIWREDHGQDLIEYALMAGFVAVAAGAIMPSVSSSISKIFSKVSSVMTAAAS